jgi:hydrogenase maturation protease
VTIKIIVLGNETAGDDGAAIVAAKQLAVEVTDKAEIIFAGRPGTGLLDLLKNDNPVILLDVISGSGQTGQIICLPLEALTEQLRPTAQTSSHGFGPTEVLSLGKVLGRKIPNGCFVGIEGEQFEPGKALSPTIQCQIPEYIDTILTAINSLSRIPSMNG